MSAARSVTAFSAACFCRTQAAPPMCASGTAPPLAADVLLHQVDLRAGHVDLRAAVVLELEMLLGLAVLLEQLQPAIAADAVRQMDDQIALPQLEKAVDRPRLPPPRGPREIVPLKQLRRAHQHDLLRHDAKPRLQVPHHQIKGTVDFFRRLVRRRLEQLAEPLDLGLRLADDEHLLAEAHLVELVAHLGDVAAEPLDRFELQVAVCSIEPDGTPAAVTDGNL